PPGSPLFPYTTLFRSYLRLMAAVADAQQAALDRLVGALAVEHFTAQLGRQIELAHEHRMPPLQAAGWLRQPRWRTVLLELCASRSEEHTSELHSLRHA